MAMTVAEFNERWNRFGWVLLKVRGEENGLRSVGAPLFALWTTDDGVPKIDSGDIWFFDSVDEANRDLTREFPEVDEECGVCGYPIGARGPGRCGCDEPDGPPISPEEQAYQERVAAEHADEPCGCGYYGCPHEGD